MKLQTLVTLAGLIAQEEEREVVVVVGVVLV